MTNATILTSPTGAASTVRPNPWDPAGVGFAVAWNGSLAVAAGNVSGIPVIQSSADLIAWTGRSSGLDADQQALCVCWFASQSLWLVGGSGGTHLNDPIIVSAASAATTWINRLLSWRSGSAQVNSIAAATSVAVAGGTDLIHDAAQGASGNSPLVYSNNGTTWTLVPDANHPFGTSGTVNGVGTDGTTFVAVGVNAGGSPILATSTDGLNWTAGTLPAHFRALCVAWDGTYWVLGGIPTGTGTMSIATSTSPSSGYTLRTSPFDNAGVSALAYSADLALWAAVGNTATGVLATTPDPTSTWTAQATPIDGSPGATLSGVCWASTLSLFGMVGNGTYTVPVGAQPLWHLNTVGWS